MIVSFVCKWPGIISLFSVCFLEWACLRQASDLPLAPKDVVKFKGEFTERLNHEISSGAAAKGNWIAGRKVWRGFVDYFLIHTESARVAKKDMVQLSDDQVKELGELINHRFEEAISAKK